MRRAASALYSLNPAMPVLLRPDGAVQVGWDPRRAVLVRPPRGLTATGLAALLRSMRSPIPITELQRQAAERGLVDGDAMANLVAQLVGAGVATPSQPRKPGFPASRRVHPGPRSRAVVRPARPGAALLRCPDQAQQPTTCGGDSRGRGSGGVVGLSGGRSAHGARSAHRESSASSRSGS